MPQHRAFILGPLDWRTGERVIAAIVFTGFMGVLLIVRRRRNVLTVGLGVACLVVCAFLVWDHLEWLQG